MRKIVLYSLSSYFEIFVCLTLHRDRRSVDLTSHLPSNSEEELDYSAAAVEDEDVRQEHVYHSLERQDHPPVKEPVYTQPLKLVKVRLLKQLAKADYCCWIIVTK